jgi:hypothetical protein
VKVTRCIARLLAPAATLISASVAWAAEPPQVGPAATNAEAQPPSSGTPAAVPVQPTATAGNASPDPVVGPPPLQASSAAAASPNSVATSPYGAAANDSVPPAPPPEPPRKKDVPATLFNSGTDYAIGGLGGVGGTYTRFAGTDQAMVCGEGAVIIDHKFTLGGGGCGIPSPMNAQRYGTAPHYSGDRMSFGYGGAIIRYHLFSREVVNLGIGALVGAGGLQIATWNGTGSEYDFGKNYTRKSEDAVFVFEPQVGGYANITRWLRIAVLGGFRFVSGVNTKGLNSSDLMGPTIGGQLQGGWF